MPVRVPKSKLWQAIKQNCLDCQGGSFKERRDCTVEDCPLWPYRNGPIRGKSPTDSSEKEQSVSKAGKGLGKGSNFFSALRERASRADKDQETA